MSETTERSNAVQLLRQATDARLKKTPSTRELHTKERKEHRRSRSHNNNNAYPGFIPDPEILERQAKLREQKLENETSSTSTSEAPPSNESPDESVYKDETDSPNENVRKPRVAFRKSGLPTKKTMAQRRSRAIHAKVISPGNHRSSRNSRGPNQMPQRRPNSTVKPSPILAPDPLGFLASRFDQTFESSSSPSANNTNPANARPSPIPARLKSPIDDSPKQLLRRSRSFNTFRTDNVHVPIEKPQINNQINIKEPPNIKNGSGLYRSKSYRQVPSSKGQPPKHIDLVGVPTNINSPMSSSSSPISGLRRWLSVGRKTRSPTTITTPPHPSPGEQPSPRTPGRMKSLKWMGKRILPEKTETQQLSRSKSTAPGPEAQRPKVTRAHTVRQGEILKSLKQFFDVFSRDKDQTSPSLEETKELEVARKPVVQNPELSLKKLVIHDSNTSLPLITDSLIIPTTPSKLVPTPNIADTDKEYFLIPPRSASRPPISIYDDRSFSHGPVSSTDLHTEYMEPAFPVISALEHQQLSNSTLLSHAELLYSPTVATPDPISSLDDPSTYERYNLVHLGPAKQILDSVTIKDRHLFLFDHLLIVAKEDQHFYYIRKVIWLDAINEVVNRRRSTVIAGDSSGQDAPVPQLPEMPRRYHPVLMSAIRRFEIDPVAAVGYLLGRGALKPEPGQIARFLHVTPELDRCMMGRFLAMERSHDVLVAYLNRFDWRELRLDLALRTLLSSLWLPNTHREIIVTQFASQWYQANQKSVSFSAAALPPLLMALFEEPVPDVDHLLKLAAGAYLDPTPELRAFVSQLYKEVTTYPFQETVTRLVVGVGGESTNRFIIGEASDPIWVKIPEPDPELKLLLHGIDLVCEPQELTFANSDTQWFTVTGTSGGRKNLQLIPYGATAHKYEFLPPKTFVVEQPFMKHTFSLSFTTNDHEDIVLPHPTSLPSRRASTAQPTSYLPPPAATKRYLFGLGSNQELTSWVSLLEETIDRYQEAQDELGEELEREAQDESRDDADSADWLDRAEEASQLRHQSHAEAAIRHFAPLLSQPLSHAQLVTLASRKTY